MEEMYYLMPNNGRQSFGGKAIVKVESNGDKVLLSYLTPVVRRKANGDLIRLYNSWSYTTGTHIKSFCGLDKKGYFALPTEEEYYHIDKVGTQPHPSTVSNY